MLFAVHYQSISMQDDADSVYKHDCRIGVNKRTGRLQWCPHCNCFRIMIIVPATIVPIVCLLLLAAHFDVVNTTKQESNINFSVNTEKNVIPEELNRDPRCAVVRAGNTLSEVLDIEDKELLKDIRTSFIPSQPMIVPPECMLGNRNDDDLYKKDERELSLLNYIRRRRSGVQTDDVETETITTTQAPPIASDIDVDQETNKEQLNTPWRQEQDPEIDSNISELDESEQENCNNCRPKVAIIHSFWKGEGTPEKIRTTQAQIMKQYIDDNIDPCVDFYQYSCGNWESLNPIPKDKAAYDTFEKLRESLDIVLRDLLLEEPINKSLIATSNNVEFSTTTEKPEETIQIKPTSGDPSDIQNALDIIARFLSIRSSHNNHLEAKLQLRHQLRRKRRELELQKLELEPGEAEVKARNLFLSCMNYKILEKRGIEPILNLAKSLGGWPVLEPNWDESKFDWLNLTSQLRLFNNDIFIVEWVGPDIKSSDENIIQFDQTGLGLPTREYFLKDNNKAYLEAYKEFMITIINLLGAEYEEATRASNEIIEFEIKLANITSSPEERSNVSVLYRRKTIAALQEEIPEINWHQYIRTVVGHDVSLNETVVMFATDYMKNLVQLISETEPRIVANYLLWRFMRHRVNNVDDRFNEAKQKFYFALFGREESPPRWKNCVNQVNSNMGMAVGAMFVRKYFDETSKRDTMSMTHELQQAFREILNSTEWIDIATKNLAELKVNSMSLRIGYPDYILSHEDLNEKYEDLNIDAEKYFENTLNVLRHLTKTEQSKLGKPVNKTAWNTAPAVVNAYYSRNKNQIMFPAGILQPPFYHRFFPKSLNYGGIGVVIGHELTHGFDDKGRLFDREGNLHRWWSEDSIKEFHNRAQCLIDQYGKYTVKDVGIAVDGENTQGENIADNGGIKQSYNAYKKWLEQQTDPEVLANELLPGLNATSTQLFFLNFAQVWCGAMRPEASRNKLKTAVHSPGKFRVIGTLSNSDEFAKEYNCLPGTPMNPIKKCKVW